MRTEYSSKKEQDANDFHVWDTLADEMNWKSYFMCGPSNNMVKTSRKVLMGG